MASYLGIDTLFRTLLPTSDPNYLPSCSGRSDSILTGMTVPVYDPTAPNQYWWVPAAASMNPTQEVSLTLWNGSELVPITMTALRASLPNLPGTTLYPPYNVPITNATWIQVPGFPANTFPSSWLSQQADASLLLSMFPGSSLETGEACYPQAVFNLDSRYPSWQPWVLVMSNGTKTFAGGLLQQMFGPNLINGGGRGNPGSWVNNAWVPTAPPTGTNAVTLGTPCLPIPSGYVLGVVQNGIVEIPALLPVAGASSGQGTLTVTGSLTPGNYNLVPA